MRMMNIWHHQQPNGLLILLILFYWIPCLSMHETLSIQQLLQKGKKRLENKKYKKARYYFKKAYKQGNTHALIYLMATHQKLINHYYELAITTQQLGLQQKADYHRIKKNHYRTAALENGDINTVMLIAELQNTDEKILYEKWKKIQLLKLQKNDPSAFLNLGIYHMLIDNDYSKAEKYFLNVTNNPIGAHNLSILYETQNKNSDAETWQSLALELGYDSASSS